MFRNRKAVSLAVAVTSVSLYYVDDSLQKRQRRRRNLWQSRCSERSSQLYPASSHFNWNAVFPFQAVLAKSHESDNSSERKEDSVTGEVVENTSANPESDLSILPQADVNLSFREQRFLQFASLELNHVPYMTPNDFLASLIGEEKLVGKQRQKIAKSDVSKLLKKTPTVGRGSEDLFRKLGYDGLISYSEYLFLLCVLTKPKTAFKVAFNMFDRDGNEKVDKQEFLVMEHIFGRNIKDKEEFRKLSEKGELSLRTDTTILVHFFGIDGKETLSYDDFHKFMDNLQTEVLEIEWEEFARGRSSLPEVDFAQILLRYTSLNEEAVNAYLNRLRSRMTEDSKQGIEFGEFKKFRQFLNSLDDFSQALRLYTAANMNITLDEFQRAINVVTGTKIDKHLLRTVFLLFDVDGDGKLSDKEFVSIMKDRLRRGEETRKRNESMKECMSRKVKEMRKSQK